MEPFDQALGLGIAGFADQHLRAQRPAERLAFRGQLGLPCPPPPDRALAVPDQHPRHRTQRRKMLPPPGIQVLGGAGRDQHRRRPPRISADHRQHRQLRSAVRTCPNPTGTSTSGNQKSHWAISPATYVVRAAGSGGRYTGRSSAHPFTERPDRMRPADPLGDHRRRHPRIRLQQLPDPRLDLIDRSTPPAARSYFGGPSEANAAFTVFLEIPNTRAISEIGNRSARCNRRISAQSSTLNTRFLPGP